MRNKFDIFCTPKKQQPEDTNIISLARLTHAASMQPIYQDPSIDVSTQIQWMPLDLLSRTIISRSNRRSTYKYPSQKNGMHMHCESKHELNAMVILESRDEVVSYQAQPAVITYQDIHGVSRLHYPDILATINNGNKLLIEIKSDKFSGCTETVWRTAHLHSELKPLGITYLLVVESQLLASRPYIQLPLIGDF